MDISKIDMIEASAFFGDGSFGPVLVDETYADAVDTVFCHAGGAVFVAGAYGTLLVGTALFEAIAGPEVISLVLPSDWGGYFGSPIEIRGSLACSGDDVLVQLENEGSTSRSEHGLIPFGDDARARYFELLDNGMDAVSAWVATVRG